MSQHEYQFGAFTIDADRGVVLRAGEETRLRRQSFEVLVYLVERPGVLVTKDELVAAIWGNTPVTDNSLTQCLTEVRKALGDSEHEIVRTVVRRGYLFEPPTDDARTSDTSSRPRLASRLAWTAAVLLFALAIVTAIVTYVERDGAEPSLDQPIESITAATLEDSPSIAILRFENTSGDDEDGLFLGGLREEIAKQLGGIDRLHVVSPLSVGVVRTRYACTSSCLTRPQTRRPGKKPVISRWP